MLGNGITTKLNEVGIIVTQSTGDIAVQLKSPASNDCAECVENHPHRLSLLHPRPAADPPGCAPPPDPRPAKGDAHNVAFGTDLTAKHKKFKEEEMVCIFGIVELADKIGE